MSILVKLSASLREKVSGYDPHTGLHMKMSPGETLALVLKELGLKPEDVKIAMINGKAANLEQALENGDRVALFPAVGGG